MSTFGGAPFNPPDGVSINKNSKSQLQTTGKSLYNLTVQPSGGYSYPLILSAGGTPLPPPTGGQPFWSISSSGTISSGQLDINSGITPESTNLNIGISSSGTVTITYALHRLLYLDSKGNLSLLGSIAHAGESLDVLAITVADTLTVNNDVMAANASTAAFTITLPAALGSGQKYLIVKTDSSTNAVTLAAAGTDTIEGSATKVLSAQYDKIAVIDLAVGLWTDLGTGGGI